MGKKKVDEKPKQRLKKGGDSELKAKIQRAKKKVASKRDLESSESEMEELKELMMPGQKFPTPPMGDSQRAFYESLWKEKGEESEMASKWCFEHGVLDPENHKKLSRRFAKK